MGTYASTSDLAPRIGDRPLTASTTPSTTHVDSWILEGEALLEGALLAGGTPVPVTADRGVTLMKTWTLDYTEARFRMSNAAAGGDGTNEDGENQLTRFEALVDDIHENPARYGAMVVGADAPEGTRQLRSNVLDDVDGRVASVDMAAQYTVADREDQF